MEMDSSMGKIYTDTKGMTLYTFDKDEAGKSNCYDQCAVNWPPFLAAADAMAEGEWTIIERTDGTKQWAYEGKPLYLWIQDKSAGRHDRRGQGRRHLARRHGRRDVVRTGGTASRRPLETTSGARGRAPSLTSAS